MGRLRYGIHRPLEDEANRLISNSLQGVTKHSDKADILTPWKQDDRLRREVYTATGTPDRSVRQGMFHRAWNPEQPYLNSRDGLARHVGHQGPQDVMDLNRLPEHSNGGRNVGGSLAKFVEARFDEPESRG